MITIKNLRYEKPTQPYQVRVDRTSILGNPYYMRDESHRDEVCDKYKLYFKEQLKTNISFRKEVERLITIHKQYGKLELFCWCAPKRCHAETIRAFINYYLQRN